MNLSGDEITIAVTVYDRREFVEQAVASALNQTVPVRVMVVEDCGPDAGLREFVLGKFGSRIQYHRNTRRRGLFDNWNACLEYCRTPWLSILHDDDYLAPNFVAALLEQAKRDPGCGLYFGDTTVVDVIGVPLPEWDHPPPARPGRHVQLEDVTLRHAVSVSRTSVLRRTSTRDRWIPRDFAILRRLGILGKDDRIFWRCAIFGTGGV